MADTFENFVGGEWVAADTGETFETRNPADPDEVVARFQQSGAEDAEAAVAAAAEAQAEWAATPATERGAILVEAGEWLAERKQEFAEELTREEGKPLSSAKGEIQRGIDTFRYYGEKVREYEGVALGASAERKEVRTIREPMGVAALITPWNYPMGIPTWKTAPAVATGNAVVLKPAEQAPTMAFRIAEALDAAGLPDGVMNVVTGPGDPVGASLLTHDDVDTVSFTGSTAVGTHIQETAATHGKRVQCEMGGKNPALVMPSADLDEAVANVGSGAFGVTGQACTATSRAVVHEDVYDEFVEGIVEYAESLSIGPGLEDPDVAPHVTESELESTLDYVGIGKEEGATHETGGERLDRDGYFVSPAVFSDVESDMRIATEEIFGPVLSVIEVSDFEAAVAVANDSRYGLSAAINTNDLDQAYEFLHRSETGVVKVNEKTTGVEPHAPFGGVKDSSTETYREQGEAGMDFYTETKTGYINY